MTDAPHDLPEGGLKEASLDWSDEVPESVLTMVSDLFTTLTKAIRAHQLYDENNPVYKRFVTGLTEAFAELWTEVDRLPVQVQENRILWRGEEVYRNENRSESLAFLFFKDGVRELTFEPGIEGEELTRLLRVLHRARNLRPESDDLLTILWDEDLRHMDYSYVDVLAEGVELPEVGGGNEESEMQAVLQGELDESGTLAPEDEDAEEGEEGTAAPEPPPGQVSTEDFNPTLYSLDAKELEKLREELDDEMSRDLRRSVLEALFDRLEEPEHRERQSEILEILRTLLPNFLSRGVLRPAAAVLHELDALRKADGMLDEARMEEVEKVLDAVSGPETVGELVRALEDGAIDAEARRLGTFLQFLRPRAIRPLLRAMEESEDRKLRETLREALTSIAGKHRGVVLELMDDDDGTVAAGASRLAGRMEIREAGPKLAGLMGRDDPDVRLAAVEATVALKASTAAGALAEILDDPDRAVRIAAARALGALRYRPATERLEKIVKSKEIRQRDVTEMIAFFESYGQLAGEEAVSLLDKYLNGKGFLGRREPEDIRACAALALGKIGTLPARTALEKAGDQEEPVVRSAVNRALRGDAPEGEGGAGE